MVVTDAPQDIHVQLVLVALRRAYAPLEHFPLLEQLLALHVPLLGMCALLGRLISSEELLQPALEQVVYDAPLDTFAQLDRLINMEEHQQLVQDQDLRYALLENIPLLVPRHAQTVPLGNFLLQEPKYVHHAPRDTILLVRAHNHALCAVRDTILARVQLVALDVPQGICALLGRSIGSEELLQAALVLVLECVLLDTSVQVLVHKRYVPLEGFRRRVQ